MRVPEVREERHVQQKDGSQTNLMLEENWWAGKGGQEEGGIGIADRGAWYLRSLGRCMRAGTE